MVTLYNVGSHLHRMVASLRENGDENRGRFPELLLQKICSIKQFYFGIHFSTKQGANQEKKWGDYVQLNWCLHAKFDALCCEKNDPKKLS